MNKRTSIQTENMRLAPISTTVQWGDLLFVSGIGAVDTATGRLLCEDISEQADAVMETLQSILEQAGTSLENVLRVECYLSDAKYFPVWNSAFAKYFPTDPPTRTTIICDLVLDKMLIEVQATCGMPS